jgi:hypothetical protein
MEQALIPRPKALKAAKVFRVLKVLRAKATKKATRAMMTSTEATLNRLDQATMHTPQTTDRLRHKTLVTRAYHQETQKHNQEMPLEDLGPHLTDLPLVAIGLLLPVNLQALQITPPAPHQMALLQENRLLTRKPTLRPLATPLRVQMTQLGLKVATRLNLRVKPPPALLVVAQPLPKATFPHREIQRPRTLLGITAETHLTIQLLLAVRILPR